MSMCRFSRHADLLVIDRLHAHSLIRRNDHHKYTADSSPLSDHQIGHFRIRRPSNFNRRFRMMEEIKAREAENAAMIEGQASLA